MSIYQNPNTIKKIEKKKKITLPDEPILIFVAKANCGVCMASKRLLDSNKIPNICFSANDNSRVARSVDELRKFPYPNIKSVAKEADKYKKNRPNLPMVVDGKEVITGTPMIKRYIEKKYLGS